eukprot:7316693-Prymnesium_polylepis.1
MLCDPAADYDAMHALVDDAIAQGDLAYAGLAGARSAAGKTPLHLAVTRGDLTLCRKLMRRQDDVLALDENRDTPLTFACLAGCGGEAGTRTALAVSPSWCLPFCARRSRRGSRVPACAVPRRRSLIVRELLEAGSL